MNNPMRASLFAEMEAAGWFRRKPLELPNAALMRGVRRLRVLGYDFVKKSPRPSNPKPRKT